MQLTFLGAADTVTGSKTLVEAGGTRLLVDCGLFQGLKRNRLRNWRPLEIAPESIDAVVLSHAHIDHSGYLPLLVREGFAGPVYVTEPTQALCRILLPDSGRIHEEDASYANRKGFSKHKPALPLYTEEDAEHALGQLEVVAPETPIAVGALEVRLRLAGHILGAATVEVAHRGRSVLFSGDLGRSDDLLMFPPADPDSPDLVVLESTYGDRHHLPQDPIQVIAAILAECLERGGTLLIPSFAVGRTQSILFCLYEAFRRELVPRVPIFVDSPMATDVTGLFRRLHDWHRLSPDVCKDVFDIAHYVRDAEESKRLSKSSEGGRVIISASGMATAGRVVHHLKQVAPDKRNTILLPGFQAVGTRGEALARGASTVKIHGRQVPVRARVEQLDLLSAHADQGELLAWIGRAERLPGRVVVNHGEPLAADTLRREIQDRHRIPAAVAEHDSTVELDPSR